MSAVFETACHHWLKVSTSLLSQPGEYQNYIGSDFSGDPLFDILGRAAKHKT